MSRWDEFRGFYPRSRPRAAKGGIRSQSKRGSFGESWWAKRWIAVLESFQIGARLGRGRSYARSGQVLSIDVGKGEITARVQGSRPQPYQVRIGVKPIGAKAWGAVVEAASRQAVFASKLLGGEMPREIEEVFRAAGVAMFPERHSDLDTDCSCPDWSNPCKHIAAVYYLLGEEFDRDPFLIFQVRGMRREEFLVKLGEGGAARTAGAAEALAAVAFAPEPLPPTPEGFWTARPIPEDLTGAAPSGAQAASASVARRLGKFPFWRGRLALADFLEDVYGRAATYAAQTLERG